MNENIRVILWSMIAAVLFCLELVVVTLTPLAQIGNGTRFGIEGMYYNLFMVGGSYFIPLILFCLNIRVMKYVIAFVNGIWIIGQVFIVLMFAGAVLASLPGFDVMSAAAAMLAGASLVAEILWDPMCRERGFLHILSGD